MLVDAGIKAMDLVLKADLSVMLEGAWLFP